jgi:acyl phosphate:glycerol-3-phosphate acyltransferase
MSIPIFIIIAALAAYLIGSVPFGYLVGRWKGIDIRQHGSGNIGATNVIRVMGKKIGIPVFILDVVKGMLPVIFVAVTIRRFFPSVSQLTVDVAEVVAALAAVCGHNYTCWLGFKGGKGVATSAGALLALMPWALLVALAVWLLTFFTSRYVSLASILASLALAVFSLGRYFFQVQHQLPQLLLALLLAGLTIWRHRANISRLRAGTEPRFEKKSKSATTEVQS